MLETAFSQAKPEILTIDQECQFTSEAWTGLLKQNAIQISMDGKGRCLDNLYRERFRRSLKPEAIYLNPPETVDSCSGAGEFAGIYGVLQSPASAPSLGLSYSGGTL